MKTSLLITFVLFANYTVAFPAHLSEAFVQLRRADNKIQAESRCPFAKSGAKDETACPFSKRQAPGVIPPFDAKSQYVSNTGSHAFQAPSGNDQRGPCE